MKNNELLTDDETDFLREMMNVGVGNAAGAFSQMLSRQVDMKVPEVYIFPVSDIPPILKEPAKFFTTVSMDMVGDVRGKLYFLMPDEKKECLIKILENAAPGGGNKGGVEVDVSALEELGNILSSVFLVAIHDFCKLNIYHTVPEMSTDMLQSLIDEPIAATVRESSRIVFMINTFIVVGEDIKTFFLIIPDVESTRKLLNSISEARKQMYE